MINNLDFAKIGKRMKARRKELGLTQQNVADTTGLTPKYISEVECGKPEGSLNTYYKIACALNYSIDFLVADSAPADSAMYDNEFKHSYSQYGKMRKILLNDYIGMLNSHPELDDTEEE